MAGFHLIDCRDYAATLLDIGSSIICEWSLADVHVPDCNSVTLNAFTFPFIWRVRSDCCLLTEIRGCIDGVGNYDDNYCQEMKNRLSLWWHKRSSQLRCSNWFPFGRWDAYHIVGVIATTFCKRANYWHCTGQFNRYVIYDCRKTDFKCFTLL